MGRTRAHAAGVSGVRHARVFFLRIGKNKVDDEAYGNEYGNVCVPDDVVLLYCYLSARVAAEIITRDVLRGGERFH